MRVALLWHPGQRGRGELVLCDKRSQLVGLNVINTSTFSFFSLLSTATAAVCQMFSPSPHALARLCMTDSSVYIRVTYVSSSSKQPLSFYRCTFFLLDWSNVVSI
jgi:hypothetical protein